MFHFENLSFGLCSVQEYLFYSPPAVVFSFPAFVSENEVVTTAWIHRDWVPFDFLLTLVCDQTFYVVDGEGDNSERCLKQGGGDEGGH